MTRPGTVHLVGAGPGDPGLLTARALELLRSADVVLHDKLIPLEALDVVRPDAEVIDVGKIGGGAQVPQDATNALLVEHARAGRDVVRLKGGDPFVFGRGGEEAQLLLAEGIPVEVVPGITAGIAASAYAGIPVTQRRMASAVAFVTGHEDPSKPESSVDWPALAAFPGTLVFYMGVRSLERIAQRLVEEGRPASEPAAVVQRGTLADQRVVSGTLADIAEVAAAAGIGAPAVTIVGPVAGLREELAWRERRPLHGLRVVVTRARPQASGLASTLEGLGAQVAQAPAIAIHPVDVDLPDLAAYDLLCLTSVNGVARLFDLVRDARALAGPVIAAIGPGTADALRAHGIEPDVVPTRAVGEGLLEALAGLDVRRAAVLRAREGRDVLPDGLRERGVEVDVVALYETRAEPLDDDARAAVLGADWITFTAGSAVRSLVAAVGGAEALRGGPRLASIGPVTSGVLRELGLEPDLEAAEHTPDGLVEALVAGARA
jgi:uroporphyrinogen III methyltransferase / synthase